MMICVTVTSKKLLICLHFHLCSSFAVFLLIHKKSTSGWSFKSQTKFIVFLRNSHLMLIIINSYFKVTPLVCQNDCLVVFH